MPPIKRNQKQGAQPARRRLAGHAGTVGSGTVGSGTARSGDQAGAVPGSGPGRTTEDEVAAAGTGAGAAPGSHAAPGAGTTAGTGPEAPAETDAAPGERTGRRTPSARTLAYAALGVGLVAGAAAAVLATEPGVSVENRAFVDRAATDEVLAAATTNVQRLVSIDHRELDQYHDSLGEFLTPKLVGELDQNWPALKDSYEQSATTVDAQVREAGLAFLQGDRAEVLLVQDVSMSRDGAAAGSTSGTYLVGLDKVDGVWKLSRIPDLPS